MTPSISPDVQQETLMHSKEPQANQIMAMYIDIPQRRQRQHTQVTSGNKHPADSSAC